MWCIRTISIWLGRPISFYWIGLLTLLITTFFRPNYLRSSGFILSFLAILGVEFSQKISGSENHRAFLPVTYKWRVILVRSYFSGWVVMVFVAPWVWWKFQVFEPLGVIMTCVLQLFISPAVWLSWWRHLFAWCTLEPCRKVWEWWITAEWVYFHLIWWLLIIGQSLINNPLQAFIVRLVLLVSGFVVIGGYCLRFWKKRSVLKKQLSCL